MITSFSSRRPWHRYVKSVSNLSIGLNNVNVGVSDGDGDGDGDGDVGPGGVLATCSQIPTPMMTHFPLAQSPLADLLTSSEQFCSAKAVQRGLERPKLMCKKNEKMFF